MTTIEPADISLIFLTASFLVAFCTVLGFLGINIAHQSHLLYGIDARTHSRTQELETGETSERLPLLYSQQPPTYTESDEAVDFDLELHLPVTAAELSSRLLHLQLAFMYEEDSVDDTATIAAASDMENDADAEDNADD